MKQTEGSRDVTLGMKKYEIDRTILGILNLVSLSVFVWSLLQGSEGISWSVASLLVYFGAWVWYLRR